MYYFGSHFGQRQFNVSFAFDDLKRSKLLKSNEFLVIKKFMIWIFDERPYKVYSAKVTSTATLKYLAFSEGDQSAL